MSAFIVQRREEKNSDIARMTKLRGHSMATFRKKRRKVEDLGVMACGHGYGNGTCLKWYGKSAQWIKNKLSRLGMGLSGLRVVLVDLECG